MFYWISLALFAVVLDQVTKILAVKYLMPVDTVPIIKSVLHLTYLENTGAAFGSLKNSRWVFLAVSTFAIIALVFYMFRFKPKNRVLSAGLAFIIGGGIGNMIDRIAKGYVVDFVDFRLVNFAVFNVADSFVCVGAALVIIYIFFFAEKEDKNAKNEKKESKNEENTDGNR